MRLHGRNLLTCKLKATTQICTVNIFEECNIIFEILKGKNQLFQKKLFSFFFIEEQEKKSKLKIRQEHVALIKVLQYSEV